MSQAIAVERSFRVEGKLSQNAETAAALKSSFPIFEEHPDLIYLDNAATTQKPFFVLAAEAAFYRESCANVHRAIHAIGEEATRRYEDSRALIARFIGVTPRELIFTRGTTESINLLAHALGDSLISGDEIMLSEMEHHANLVPWFMLRERKGVVLRFIPVSDDGQLDLVAFERLLGSRTRLVSLTMASNVLGTINPVDRIIDRAHQAGSLVMLDAAQAVPRSHLDAHKLGADFIAFSGHKMYGPTGIGCLYGRERLLDAMPPFMGGGDMISEVTLEGFTVNELPYKFEAGTPPIAQAVGLAAAAEWLDSIDADALGMYEAALARRFIAGIAGISGVRILGSAPERAGIVAFTIDGVHAHDVAAFLDKGGIAVRAGHHCAHPLARRFGVVSSVRASFGAYNLPEDVDTAIEMIARAAEEL